MATFDCCAKITVKNDDVYASDPLIIKQSDGSLQGREIKCFGFIIDGHKAQMAHLTITGTFAAVGLAGLSTAYKLGAIDGSAFLPGMITIVASTVLSLVLSANCY